jgi:hypothetical protein
MSRRRCWRRVGFVLGCIVLIYVLLLSRLFECDGAYVYTPLGDICIQTK